LGNAVKYSGEASTITISLAREENTAGACAVVAVRDQGVGIPAADLSRVFERFRRGANVAERMSGTGVGLACASQIVAQHGGTITVESAEGAGATFTVRLPLGRDGDTEVSQGS
jgi:signal transduction histidine kinase